MTMKYVCNYSNELIELIQEDPRFCDYIKIGAFGLTLDCLESAFSYKPLMIHGFGWFERGGMATIDVMDFDQMNSLMKKYGSPCLGMHALAYPKDQIREDLVSHMTQILRSVQKKLSYELIIENMDYSPFYDYETTVIESVKPEFYTKLLHSTGLNMLLDISHAKVSAYQIGMDIYDYLEELPLEKVREIHISGSAFDEGKGYRDVHGVMEEEDYQIALFLSKHSRIVAAKKLKYITLEYGTIEKANKQAVFEQMKRLKRIFR